MEEFSDQSNVMNSPHELAIQFLLRHATCRMALSSEADEAHQRLVAALHKLDAAGEHPEAADAPAGTPPAAANSKPAKPIAAEDTCAARFARAYAAARHKSTSSRDLDPGKKAAA